MMFPKKILIITSWYPSNERPTYGSFVEEQALLLQKKGHEVKIIQAELTGTFKDSLHQSKKELRLERNNGLEILRVKGTPVLPKARSLSYQKIIRIVAQNINKLYPSDLPDIIHSHSIFLGGIIAEHMSRILQIPFVHTEHTSSLLFKQSDYNRKDLYHLRRVYQKAKKVIFVSHYFKDEFIKEYSISADYTVVPNLVHASFFDNEFKKTSFTNSAISIGNLLPVKNYELLIKAVAIVVKTHPDFKLTIAGDGLEKERLINQIKSLCLTDNIQIIDRLSRSEVRQKILENDFTISSSKLETFGLTVAESIACGRPVVVTDSGGVRDFVLNETGLITKQDEQSLAEGIISMIKNYNTFDPKDLSNYAKSHLSNDVIYSKLLALYKEK